MDLWYNRIIKNQGKVKQTMKIPENAGFSQTEINFMAEVPNVLGGGLSMDRIAECYNACYGTDLSESEFKARFDDYMDILINGLPEPKRVEVKSEEKDVLDDLIEKFLKEKYPNAPKAPMKKVILEWTNWMVDQNDLEEETIKETLKKDSEKSLKELSEEILKQAIGTNDILDLALKILRNGRKNVRVIL